ncbi:MAG: carotenoid biosynthesis protein [Syntrophobacteraceae bacterium]
MPETLKLLWGTLILRPYVFAFLAVYLVAGWRHMGWKKTLVFIPVGYALAWASEFASIHWGFPYGDYFYIPSTVDRELWVLGVPFMDSLSYVFLSYCSYSLATFIMSPVSIKTGHLCVLDTPRIRRSWQVLVLGAFLFVTLDIIIDPVALQGERWFLGKIYGYRQEGFYFGIPMSNFGGWLLVGFVLTAAIQVLERARSLQPGPEGATNYNSWSRLLGPVLYFSVLVFNIAVTFYIGEMLMGIVGLLIFSALLIPMFFFILYKNAHPAPELTPAHQGQLPVFVDHARLIASDTKLTS